MNIMLWWGDEAPIPEAFAQRCADLGASGVRYTGHVYTVNPAPGQLNWSVWDESIDMLRKHGLDVYLDPTWFPAHWSGGQPAYMRFELGCARFVPGTTSGALEYAADRDYCTTNIPHLDTAVVESFAAAAAEHFRGRVKWYGIGNEPDIELFWPPTHLNGLLQDWRPSATRAALEMSQPWAKGVRSVIPDAILVGPECATVGFLHTMLEVEQASGERWYDVVSFHDYAFDGTFPQDAIRRLDNEFVPALADVLDGRPMRIGEVGMEHGEPPSCMPPYLNYVHGRGVVDAVTVGYNIWKSGPGVPAWEPSADFTDLQRTIRMIKLIDGGRVRAVRA
jgi:hypothetical protein